jgi:hypothetical protein
VQPLFPLHADTFAAGVSSRFWLDFKAPSRWIAIAASPNGNITGSLQLDLVAKTQRASVSREAAVDRLKEAIPQPFCSRFRS